MISRCGRRAWGSGSRCRARAASPITRRAAPTSAAAPSRATSPSSSTPSTRREWRCPAPSPPCWRRASRPTGRSPFRRRWCPTSEPTVWFLPVMDRGLRRRAGPRAVVVLALLLGGITVGYTWVVARHLRDDARDTSRLLGRVFAGLNDPRPDAATDALLDLAAWAYRQRLAATRDRLWVAMARESAHQLGTPLMSLTGWIAYLREHPGTTGGELAEHLQADTERLERVAKRFERIGRPVRQEAVGLGAVAERVVSYFRPRLPTLASPVRLELVATGPGPTALGDPVLIEWAVEALVKNAIDALSGRGGRIEVRVEAQDHIARVRVRDDGPGVPAAVRTQLFEPGVSTKPGGWGIGLALARRIVEQQHHGRIQYHAAATGGSEFVLEFPLVATP